MRGHSFRLALLLAVAYVLFFHRLGQRGLWSSHEARAAQDALSILKEGRWLVPQLLDGRPELQKPPLYYWLVACFSWPGGEVTATTVRLPAALAALLTILAAYAALAYLGRPHAGLLAALLLATCVRFTWLARVGRIDLPLTAAVTVALLGIFLAWKEGQAGRLGRCRAFALLAYLAAAAGVMLKGPIGLALPGVVLLGCGGWAWFTGGRRRLSAGLPPVLLRSVPWGLPLVAALTLPWCFAANAATHGRFFEEFLWKHNLQRGLGGDEQLDGHEHPFWFYGVQFWADAAPWSLALVGLGVAWAERKRTNRQGTTQAEDESGKDVRRFGLVWFLSVFIFLSLMKYKRPDYLLPAYPGLALWLALESEAWAATLSTAGQRRARLAFAGVFGLCLAGWLGFVDFWLPREEPKRSVARFAEEVRRHAGGEPALFFRVEVHELSWHVGWPLQRLWEWENLDVWIAAEQPRFVVTTEQWAADWQNHLEAGRLRRVLAADAEFEGQRQKERLVLMVSEPAATPAADR